ncbi:MAG: hypothetical protein Q9172_006055 [Xanthocarpia lactea]
MVVFSRRRPRILRYILTIVLALPAFDFLSNYQSSYPQLRTTSSASKLKNTRSVYIASTIWNSGSLLQDHWIPSLLQITDDLKAANITVFISIYENGSWDSTKSILRQLRRTLEGKGIQHEIAIDDTSHEDIIVRNASSHGWLATAHGREMRRIPYLATVRNQALKPLATLLDQGVKFDKMIYINDVVFKVGLHLVHPPDLAINNERLTKPTDVFTLLNTRDGVYAAACALDFLNPPWNRVDAKTRGLHPPGLYDDFATRDSDGNIIGSHLYPYFSSRSSQKAILSGLDTPVQSCWNGIGNVAISNVEDFEG